VRRLVCRIGECVGFAEGPHGNVVGHLQADSRHHAYALDGIAQIQGRFESQLSPGDRAGQRANRGGRSFGNVCRTKIGLGQVLRAGEDVREPGDGCGGGPAERPRQTCQGGYGSLVRQSLWPESDSNSNAAFRGASSERPYPLKHNRP